MGLYCTAFGFNAVLTGHIMAVNVPMHVFAGLLDLGLTHSFFQATDYFCRKGSRKIAERKIDLTGLRTHN